MTENLDYSWDIIITPTRKWWDLRLKEVWHYRDLAFMLVSRNFAASYKQTILGPLWHLINPIFSTVIYQLIFNRIAGLSTDGLPPFLFYLSGNVAWAYFVGSFRSTSNTFNANKGLFGKVYFPRLIMPISDVMTNFISVSIRFGLFIIFLIYFLLAGFSIEVSWLAIFSPVLFLINSGLGLSMGIMVSSLTTKYRDLQVLVGYGLQLLLYATPVIYPASMVPAQFRVFYFLNPIAPIVEAFRHITLGEGTISAGGLAYSFGMMILLFFIGLVRFNKTETNFVDTV
ncbi:MAG: ABC transporter permease [Anaerolineales bacterium]|jgi:lipopolysaccharide transport system permease protein